MEFRRLGNSGPSVSLLGLGCNNFGRRIGFEDSVPVVEKALAVGVTFFDTADSYGEGLSEEWLGRILGLRRKTVVVATKFGMAMPAGSGAAPRYVARAAEASLKRLGTDYIDLYQLHRPDPATPIEDTLGAMDKLVRDGKVRQIGCTYLTGAEFARSRAAAAKKGFTPSPRARTNTISSSAASSAISCRRCEKTGAGFMPYLPLAGGLLTGKYRRGATVPEDSRLRQGALAGEPGDERAQLAHPGPARGILRRARAHRARARHELARAATVRHDRHRRRDQGRAGRGEPARAVLDAFARRSWRRSTGSTLTP